MAQINEARSNINRLRSERGVLVGLIAVIALPILIIFMGLGLETVRAKYLRARLDHEVTNLCASIAADAPFQARAIERFRRILGQDIADGKLHGATLVGAKLIYPTQVGSQNPGTNRYGVEPYNWRTAGYKTCTTAASRAPQYLGSGSVSPNKVAFADIDASLSCTTFLASGDCEYVWDPCGTDDARADLWSPHEDAGATFACEITAKFDSFLNRALDTIPGGAQFKPFGVNDVIVSRVVWEVAPLPPFNFNPPGNGGTIDYNVGAATANLPYAPLTVVIAPEMVTSFTDSRFAFPSAPPASSSFSSNPADYDDLRELYDLGSHPGNDPASVPLGAFSTAQTVYSNAGPSDFGPAVAFPPFGAVPTPQPTFRTNSFDATSAPGTPAVLQSGEAQTRQPSAPQPVPTSAAAGLITPQWRDAAVAATNPLVLARNILSSTFLEIAGRLGAYRFTTELLVVNPRHSAATTGGAPYTDFTHPNPPALIMEAGEDPFSRRYQLPYVYFRNPNLFDPDALLGWPYPWTGAAYADHRLRFQARLVSQLRGTFHLYQRDWYDTNSSPWIARYLLPLFSGGFGGTSAQLVNNRLGNVSFEDPAWLFPTGSSGTSNIPYNTNSSWNGTKIWDQEHPWSLTSSSNLSAPEVAALLGTVQSCPVDGEIKFNHGATSIPCAKNEEILRPDFVALFLYLFRSEASTLASSGTLNPLMTAAEFQNFSSSHSGYAYQSPGMWYVSSTPTDTEIDNPFNFSSSDDTLSTIGSPNNATRMRRARNENSSIVIFTHKAPWPPEQAIINNLIGCSKRRIIIVYMPTGIYDLEINSGSPNYDLHGRYSDESGFVAWSNALTSPNSCGNARVLQQLSGLRKVLWLSPFNPEFDALENPDGTPMTNPYSGITGNAAKYSTYWLDLLNDRQDPSRPYQYAGAMAQTILRRLLTVSGYKY